MVIYKYGGSGYHLSVKFAPYCLAPACVRHGQVQALLCEVMPVTASNYMSERI